MQQLPQKENKDQKPEVFDEKAVQKMMKKSKTELKFRDSEAGTGVKVENGQELQKQMAS